MKKILIYTTATLFFLTTYAVFAHTPKSKANMSKSYKRNKKLLTAVETVFKKPVYL